MCLCPTLRNPAESRSDLVGGRAPPARARAAPSARFALTILMDYGARLQVQKLLDLYIRTPKPKKVRSKNTTGRRRGQANPIRSAPGSRGLGPDTIAAPTQDEIRRDAFAKICAVALQVPKTAPMFKEMLYSDLDAKSTRSRLLALHVVDALFTRSPAFRALVLADLQPVVLRVVGSTNVQLQASLEGKRLVEQGLGALGRWHRAIGSRPNAHSLRRACRYIVNVLGLEFPRGNAGVPEGPQGDAVRRDLLNMELQRRYLEITAVGGPLLVGTSVIESLLSRINTAIGILVPDARSASAWEEMVEDGRSARTIGSLIGRTRRSMSDFCGNNPPEKRARVATGHARDHSLDGSGGVESGGFETLKNEQISENSADALDGWDGEVLGSDDEDNGGVREADGMEIGSFKGDHNPSSLQDFKKLMTSGGYGVMAANHKVVVEFSVAGAESTTRKGSLSVAETKENAVVFAEIKRDVQVMQDKYKPVVTDWLSVLSRVKLSGSREGLTILEGPGVSGAVLRGPGAENRREIFLQRVAVLKQRMDDVETKVAALLGA